MQTARPGRLVLESNAFTGRQYIEEIICFSHRSLHYNAYITIRHEGEVNLHSRFGFTWFQFETLLSTTTYPSEFSTV